MNAQDLRRIAYEATEARDAMYARVEGAGLPRHQPQEATLKDGTRVCFRCLRPVVGNELTRCGGHWAPVDRPTIPTDTGPTQQELEEARRNAFRKATYERRHEARRAAQAAKKLAAQQRPT